MKFCAAFVVLVCCAGFCAAIQCYTCDSITESNCADEFNPSGITVEKNCVECWKAKHEANGSQIVARKCFTTDGSLAKGCHSFTEDSISGNVCVCSSDLCNSGPIVAARFTIGVVPLIMFLRSL
ncbi:hypothetical protein DPMN_167191 [Dreissena polymorpha]|uniref:Protein quiver n=1 Tax=Dreissena polymorpha TaxID=45954 RepID=A0A9D4EYC0_DREPO|nr:hypothetical protein DPMN_167191 [Dreissena polymorpha]